MEKQMRAEREKREKILGAEGTRNADILRAEGEKKAAILMAEGERESLILKAEGIKKSIELINLSEPSKEALILKSFEALSEISKGEATTILMPSDLTEISKLAATFGIVNKKINKSSEKPKSRNLEEIIDKIKDRKK